MSCFDQYGCRRELSTSFAVYDMTKKRVGKFRMKNHLRCVLYNLYKFFETLHQNVLLRGVCQLTGL